MPTGILTISVYTTSPPQQVDANSSLEVRGWYSQNFVSIDGVTPVLGNSTNGEQGPYYSTTPTLNPSGDLIVPEHDVQITVGANPTANYFEGLWVDGAFTVLLMPNTQGATGWQIPSVYGDPIAYDEIATYNRARRLVYPPDTYFTADETIQEIKRIAGDFDYMAVGVNGIGQASVPPLVASAPIVVMNNDPRVGYMINVKGYPYYAVGDGITDDTAALLAARTAALITGGTLYFPPGTYKYTSPLTVGSQGVWLVGDSPQVTTLLYTGTGTSVTLGSLTTSSLIYGMGIQGLQILTNDVAGNHLAIGGTSGAVARDLILQGQASALTTSTALLLDDANIGNQFTSIENVQAIHVKFGLNVGGAAPLTVTAVDCKNLSIISNATPIAGSKGIVIAENSGNGSVFKGTHLESLAEGIDYTGNNVLHIGTRFEGCTHNVLINALGSGLATAFPLNWDTAKYTDNSGNINQIIAPFDSGNPALPLLSILGSLTANGKLIVTGSNADTQTARLVNTNAVNGYGIISIVAANDTTRYSWQAIGNSNRVDFTVYSNGITVPRLLANTEGAALTVSGNTITPTNNVHQVGAGLIKTITVPSGFNCGTIALVPTAAFTYDATNNVLGTGTAVVGRTMFATYSGSTGKWSMSY